MKKEHPRVVNKLKPIFYATIVCAATLSAAPKLQVLQTSLPVVTVAQNANGSTSVDIKNTGDGSLSPQVTGSASWLVPTVGASHACSDGSGGSCLPVQISLQTSALAKGLYIGTVTINDPNAVDAPQNVTVAVQVIGGLPSKIDFTIIQGTSASADFNNQGQVSSAKASSAQNWLSVAQDGGSPFSPSIPYKVTASTGTLAVGDYQGTVNLDANSIPATLHVIKQPISGPLASIGGALNNTTYAAGESLAQGDIIALFGSQFATGDPAGATGLPLGTTLGGVQVLLNGTAVPMYYVSPGQINFQLPYEAAVGPGTLQVVSNGVSGNKISVTVARSVPRLLRINNAGYGDYGIIVNPDNSFVIPAAIGGKPAKVGGTIILYAIGAGPTSPAVASGTGSPASPLATVVTNPKVCFSNPNPFSPGLCVAPSFAGLTPNFVGLYQINVVIPIGSPTGDIVPIYLTTDDGKSNTVAIAVTP